MMGLSGTLFWSVSDHLTFKLISELGWMDGMDGRKYLNATLLRAPLSGANNKG